MGKLQILSSFTTFLILLIVSIGIVLSWTHMVEKTWTTYKGDLKFARPNNLEPATHGEPTRTHSAPAKAALDMPHWWCSGRGDPTKPPLNDKNPEAEKYFLTAVLVVRIYAKDIGKITARDLVHWIQYLSWAGVEHVYVYDAHLYQNESQRGQMRCFIENGFVTYVDWSHRAVPDISIRNKATQRPAYNDCWEQFGHLYVWQLVMDIDEYPYSPIDEHPGFLRRTILQIIQNKKGKRICQINLMNFMFIGKSMDDKEHPFLIDRFRRRTKKPFVIARSKHVYLSKGAITISVHESRMMQWCDKFSPNVELLRMNHYHGERRDVVGDLNIQSMTQVDWGMNTSVLALRVCHKGCPLGCC